jgi:predicted RNA-binding protein with PUA-like domain
LQVAACRLTMRRMAHWLVKTEPDVYSIDDLSRDRDTDWTGVRNYQARNFLKEMAVLDRVLIYHSNAEPSGVVGIGSIAAKAAPDKTQFERSSEYFDPKATKDSPRWFCPKVRFVKKLRRLVPLEELRRSKELAGLLLLQPGTRLSVIPVSEKHFKAIVALGS